MESFNGHCRLLLPWQRVASWFLCNPGLKIGGMRLWPLIHSGSHHLSISKVCLVHLLKSVSVKILILSILICSPIFKGPELEFQPILNEAICTYSHLSLDLGAKKNKQLILTKSIPIWTFFVMQSFFSSDLMRFWLSGDPTCRGQVGGVILVLKTFPLLVRSG